MKKIILFALISVLLSACGSPSKPVEIVQKPECFNGYTEYKDPSGHLEFCYDPEWGTPQSQEIGNDASKATKITFTNESSSPEITYYDKNFDGFCFNCFDLVGAEEFVVPKFAEALGVKESEFSYRKTDISGKRAARVEINGELRFYVPDAFADKNLLIKGSTDIAADLDDFTYNVILK